MLTPLNSLIRKHVAMAEYNVVNYLFDIQYLSENNWLNGAILIDLLRGFLDAYWSALFTYSSISKIINPDYASQFSYEQITLLIITFPNCSNNSLRSNEVIGMLETINFKLLFEIV